MIEKKKFVSYTLPEDKKQDSRVIPLKMNLEEQHQLSQIQDLLQQEQESTAIKQCIDIASKVLLEQKTLVILSHVLNNYRRNKRKGVLTYDDTNYKNFIKGNTFE